jgi:hypothetical protein
MVRYWWTSQVDVSAMYVGADTRDAVFLVHALQSNSSIRLFATFTGTVLLFVSDHFSLAYNFTWILNG